MQGTISPVISIHPLHFTLEGNVNADGTADTIRRGATLQPRWLRLLFSVGLAIIFSLPLLLIADGRVRQAFAAPPTPTPMIDCHPAALINSIADAVNAGGTQTINLATNCTYTLQVGQVATYRLVEVTSDGACIVHDPISASLINLSNQIYLPLVMEVRR